MTQPTGLPDETPRQETPRKGVRGKPQGTPLEQLGGTSGMVYMTLPIVAFVTVNATTGLNAAVVAAFAVALGITALRLIRKESLRPAFNGVTGVAVAAGISYQTGSAKDYFLVGIWAALVGCIVLVASVLVRRPLAGLVWNALSGHDNAWLRDKRSRYYYDIATLCLAAVFGARFVVKKWLYDADATGWLGFAKIVMGYPLLALGLLAVMWASRRSRRRLEALAARESAQRPAQQPASSV